MKVMKKFGSLALLLVITLLMQDASALYNMPESTYQDGAWQGTANYVDVDLGFDVLIDFAVYDFETMDLDLGESGFVTNLIDAVGLTGRYIYAYQLFNRPNEGENEYGDVGYFGILDIDGEKIDEVLINDDTGSMAFGNAVAPTYIPRQGAWGFGEGVLTNDNYSEFLVFSSDYAPVRGKYEINPPDYDWVPSTSPEPATIVLLTFGSVISLRKRRNSV